MLFGGLIKAKKLTILKGISNFFFLLYHLWHVYAFFTYAQVKYPLGFPLIMIVGIMAQNHGLGFGLVRGRQMDRG